MLRICDCALQASVRCVNWLCLCYHSVRYASSSSSKSSKSPGLANSSSCGVLAYGRSPPVPGSPPICSSMMPGLKYVFFAMFNFFVFINILSILCFAARYFWHIYFFFQRVIAEHSPNVSVVHWVFYTALPSSYFAYRRYGCFHFYDL